MVHLKSSSEEDVHIYQNIYQAAIELYRKERNVRNEKFIPRRLAHLHSQIHELEIIEGNARRKMIHIKDITKDFIRDAERGVHELRKKERHAHPKEKIQIQNEIHYLEHSLKEAKKLRDEVKRAIHRNFSALRLMFWHS